MSCSKRVGGMEAMTLRRAGRLHHLGIGAAHRGRRVLAIIDEREVTVVDRGTGEVLSSHRIEPERSYWRDQRRDPGRWPGVPGAQVTAEQGLRLSSMSRLMCHRCPDS